MNHSTRVTLDGRACIVPDARAFPAAAKLANSFWCPLGPAAGKGWVLLLQKDVDAVLAADVPYHELAIETSGEANQKRARFPSLIVVQSERLAGGAEGDPAALHLVELADKRWLLNQFTDTGVQNFNIRSYAHGEDYLAGTEDFTWAEAVESIWITMPLLGQFPGLPGGLLTGGPENLRLIGISAWQALHEVLAQLQCTTAYDPLADEFSIVRLGAIQSGLPASIQGLKLFSAEPRQSNGVRFPETIRVYFHTHRRSYGQERDTEQQENWSLAGHSKSLDVPSGISGAAAGTVLPLWDDLPHLLDEDNEWENPSELSERAIQRAAAWVAKRLVADRPRWEILPGMETGVVPGPQIKAVLWRAWGIEAGGTATELISHAGLPREIVGGRTIAEGIRWHGGQATGNYLSPDLPRRSYPNYPRILNIVRVEDSSAEPGHAVEPNDDGLIPGVVNRWVAGELAELEPCWIRPVSLEAGLAPDEEEVVSLRQHDRYVGRLCGIETSGEETRPLYLVQKAQGWNITADCADLAEWLPADRVDDVASLAVNKAAGLRLWKNLLTGQPLLDLGGGPAGSLFWQGSGSNISPRFSRSPSLATSLRIGASAGEGFLHLGGGASAGGGVWHLSPASGGGNKIRWPETTPPGRDSHLYVNALADSQHCIGLEWTYQGMSAGFYAVSASPDLYTAGSFVFITIHRGLVTGIEGLPLPISGDTGGISCYVEEAVAYDPCS